MRLRSEPSLVRGNSFFGLKNRAARLSSEGRTGRGNGNKRRLDQYQLQERPGFVRLQGTGRGEGCKKRAWQADPGFCEQSFNVAQPEKTGD